MIQFIQILEYLVINFSFNSQIHTASFVGVPSKYFKAVLKVLGPELTHLVLESCYALNVNDLAPCSRLESLRVRSLTSFNIIIICFITLIKN